MKTIATPFWAGLIAIALLSPVRADTFALERMPEDAPYVRTGEGRVVRLSRHLNDRKIFQGRGWRPATVADQGRQLGHSSLSLAEIAVGSSVIRDQTTRAQAYLDRALPFIVQGESGTGKTALLAALHASADIPNNETLTIDCAVLGDDQRIGRLRVRAELVLRRPHRALALGTS